MVMWPILPYGLHDTHGHRDALIPYYYKCCIHTSRVYPPLRTPPQFHFVERYSKRISEKQLTRLSIFGSRRIFFSQRMWCVCVYFVLLVSNFICLVYLVCHTRIYTHLSVTLNPSATLHMSHGRSRSLPYFCNSRLNKCVGKWLFDYRTHDDLFAQLRMVLLEQNWRILNLENEKVCCYYYLLGIWEIPTSTVEF